MQLSSNETIGQIKPRLSSALIEQLFLFVDFYSTPLRFFFFLFFFFLFFFFTHIVDGRLIDEATSYTRERCFRSDYTLTSLIFFFRISISSDANNFEEKKKGKKEYDSSLPTEELDFHVFFHFGGVYRSVGKDTGGSKHFYNFIFLSSNIIPEKQSFRLNNNKLTTELLPTMIIPGEPREKKSRRRRTTS